MKSGAPSKKRQKHLGDQSALLSTGSSDAPLVKYNMKQLKELLRDIKVQSANPRRRNSSFSTHNNSDPTGLLGKHSSKAANVLSFRKNSKPSQLLHMSPSTTHTRTSDESDWRAKLKLDGFFRTTACEPWSEKVLIIQKSTICTLESEYLKRKKMHEKLHEGYVNNPSPVRPKKVAVPSHEYRPVPKSPPKKVCGHVVARRPQTRSVPAIPIKEAMRDREWLTRAKDQVQRDFHEALTRSHGLQIVRPAEPLFTYKYCLGNGNNPVLVKAVMGTRPWWVRVPYSEKQSAAVWVPGPAVVACAGHDLHTAASVSS